MSIATTTILLYALLILQLVIGVRIVRSRDVFSATMLTGAFSLLGASLFMVLDAADVAFTEAAVGAGISTALVLGALALLRFRKRGPRRRSRGLGFVACLGFFVLWLSLVPQMPILGDEHSPLQAHPATADYFALTAEAIEIPNVVTAVLGSYRGFDTLGEAFVIFIAGLAVYLLLGSTRDRPLEPERHDANG